jgi:death on curing protein
MFHIAQNHPFVDGNKRAAVMSALAFLNVNGIQELPDPEDLESITLRVAAGELGKDALTKWFRKHVGRRK